MARPPKAGLDYFPLDVFIDKDDDIELLEGKYGNDGFALLIKTYMKIYADKGYYIEVNEKNITILGKRTNITFEKVVEIFNDLTKWGIFDVRLYEEYKILTSLRVQKTYIDAAIRRKEIDIISEFLLLKDINVNINLLQVETNDINVDIEQTLIPKVKKIESKVNRKEIESKTYTSVFDNFWKVCPNKKSKGATFKLFQKHVKSGISVDVLIKAMKAYSNSVKGKNLQYVKHPSTWLNQECWNDEYENVEELELEEPECGTSQETIDRWEDEHDELMRTDPVYRAEQEKIQAEQIELRKEYNLKHGIK